MVYTHTHTDSLDSTLYYQRWSHSTTRDDLTTRDTRGNTNATKWALWTNNWNVCLYMQSYILQLHWEVNSWLTVRFILHRIWSSIQGNGQICQKEDDWYRFECYDAGSGCLGLGRQIIQVHLERYCIRIGLEQWLRQLPWVQLEPHFEGELFFNYTVEVVEKHFTVRELRSKPWKWGNSGKWGNTTLCLMGNCLHSLRFIVGMDKNTSTNICLANWMIGIKYLSDTSDLWMASLICPGWCIPSNFPTPLQGL